MMSGRFNKKFMSYVGCTIWIFLIVSLGFSESFPDRPTQAELKTVVTLGMECTRGVNERCWATQYQTNPVQYQVSPFTNDSCWYLDQSLMETMAAKIRSLVPYYADQDTVYYGTTNIVMLSVSNLWTELEIGDHTNQFTQTFASGTNSAVYGDSPWRICQENLDERYDALNALKITLITGQGVVTGFYGGHLAWDADTWEESKAYSMAHLEGSSLGVATYPCFSSGVTKPDQSKYMSDMHDYRIMPVSGLNTSITHSAHFFFKPTIPTAAPMGTNSSVFYDNGLDLQLNVWKLIFNSANFGVTPAWCNQPGPATSSLLETGMGPGYSSMRGFMINVGDRKNLFDWNFQYCE